MNCMDRINDVWSRYFIDNCVPPDLLIVPERLFLEVLADLKAKSAYQKDSTHIPSSLSFNGFRLLPYDGNKIECFSESAVKSKERNDTRGNDRERVR